MRILSFTTLFPNDVNPLHGLFVFERLRAMAQFAEVDVIAPVPYFPRLLGQLLPPLRSYTRYADMPMSSRRGGLSVIHPRYLTFPKVMKGLDGEFMYRSVRNAVQQFTAGRQYDLLDAHWVYPDGYAAMKLARDLGIPYAVSMRGDDISTFATLPDRRERVRDALAAAQIRIGVCRALCDEADKLVADGRPCHVIGNGVKTKLFTRRPQHECRQRLGLDPGRRVVLSVGHLCERKGFHILIDAFAHLVAQGNTDAQLVIVGGAGEEGDFEAQLKSAAASLPPDTVVFAGPRAPDELVDWYSAADVFCLASSREGWPNVVMEAMACGTPVVATRVWGTPEIITSDALGILVERNAQDFATAIDAAVQQSWDHAAIMAHVHRRDWQVVGREVVDLFASELGTGV